MTSDLPRTPPSPRPGGKDAERRDAAPAAATPRRGWRSILWRTYGRFGEDRILLVSAGVAFYALLALFPAIATLVTLYALFADANTIRGHLDMLIGVLPSGAIDILGDQLKRIAATDNRTLGLGFFVAFAFSLWSANAGIKSLFDALNVAYQRPEERGFIALNWRSLVFTLCAILFLIVAIGLTVVVPVALDFLGLKSATGRLISILRWPAFIAIATVALSALYRFGPSRRGARLRWITWGSGGGAIVWLAVSAAFSWYTAHFGTYNATYGSLGAAIGFLTWIWISVAVILLGAELNAELER